MGELTTSQFAFNSAAVAADYSAENILDNGAAPVLNIPTPV